MTAGVVDLVTKPLSPSDQLAVLRRVAAVKPYQWDCTVPGCDGKPHKGSVITAMPHKHARSTQLPPAGDWWAWFMMSGRGFGKTRSGAEWVKRRMMAEPGHRAACIVPTFSDGRDTCVEGESGLIGGDNENGLFPPGTVKVWNRSIGELHLVNGSMLKIFGTADRKDAERLRGYQCHSAWFEEIGTQQFGDVAWDMLAFALRLGDDPRVVITGTPRPTPLIRKLVADGDVIITGGSTLDNADNLAPKMLERVVSQYEGTNLGAQELHGVLLDGAQGALWSHKMFDPRFFEAPDLVRTVVAVDPAGSANKTSDLTGIVVIGIDAGRQLWVLADRSGRYSPEQWREIVCTLVEDYEAESVVGEMNFGGDLVAANLRTAKDPPRFRPVTASKGKLIRATPVLGLYEQGRVRHLGVLSDLEQEMCTWVPPGQYDNEGNPIEPSKKSPDRLDALVWGATELAGLSRKRRGKTTMHYED